MQCCQSPYQFKTGGICYNAISTLYDWNAAESYCLANGGHLISIRSAAEATDIYNSILVPKGWTTRTIWVGLNDKANEGSFVWSDSSTATYRPWAAGEPNDYGTGEDCAQYTYPSMNDFTCTG